MTESFMLSPTWEEIAIQLGLTTPGRAFPAQLCCPACTTGRLTIYQDTVKRAFWHHCTGCGSQGDMITLAASTWKTTPEGAEARLANVVKPTKPGPGALLIPRFQALWAAAQKRLTPALPDSLRPLAQHYKVFSPLEGLAFMNAFGPLYGVVTRALVERAMRPHGPFPEERDDFELSWGDTYNGTDPVRISRNGQSQAVFSGRDWTYLLFVPYFDLPGRVTAFFCLGRGAQPRDHVYLSLPDYQHEFGLAGLAALPAVTADFGRHVFAVDDPLLMLRLQAKHFCSATRHLPLVAWHDSSIGATARGWMSLEGRPVIFWAPRPDVRVVRQAMVVDGQIAVFGPEDPERMDELFWRTTPTDILKRARKLGRPWRDVVREWETTRPDLYARIVTELCATDTHHVLDHCTARSAEFVAVAHPRFNRSVVYNGATVTEHPDGHWTVTQTRDKRGNHPGCESLLCEASLRITELEFLSRGSVRCHCVVRYKGEDLPLTATKAQLTEEAFACMDRTVIQHRKGILSCKRGWMSHLYNLALQFHDPKIRASADENGSDTPGALVVNPETRPPGCPCPPAGTTPAG